MGMRITIQDLDQRVEAFIRIRAAENRRSVEQEVHAILGDAVIEPDVPEDLVEFTRECFAEFGGIELNLPKRGTMGDPLDDS